MGVFDKIKELTPYFFWKKGNNAISGHTMPAVCGTVDLGSADFDGEGNPHGFRNIYATNYYQVNCETGVVTPLSGGGGGGKPYATAVVAASDSTATGAASADYVCSGTADQGTINTAINSLTVGGRVLLLEGTYNITGDINISGKSNITLEGIKRGAVLKIPNSTSGTIRCISVDSSSGIAIKNIKIDGNKANNGSGSHMGVYVVSCTNVLIDNVECGNTRAGPLSIDYSEDVIVNGCHFHNGGVGFGVGRVATEEVANLIISNCTVYANRGSNILLYKNTNSVIVGCTISIPLQNAYLVQVYECNGVTIGGNELIDGSAGVFCDQDENPNTAISIVGNRFYDCGNETIYLAGTSCTVSGNHVFGSWNGVSLWDAKSCSITGNVFYQVKGTGLTLWGGTGRTNDDIIISGNSFAECAYFYNDSNPMIYMRENNNRVSIVANQFSWIDHANSALSCVGFFAASTVDTVVVGNDFRNTKSVPPFSNLGSGTNTVTTYPGGAIGDNFG